MKRLKSNLKKSRNKRMLSRKRKLILQNIIVITFIIIVVAILVTTQVNPDFFDFMGSKKDDSTEQVIP